MKLIIIALSVVSITKASLEPTGYRPPGTPTASDRYLPPSYRGASPRGVLTPESHYLPPNHQSSPQNVIPNSLYLPSNHVSGTVHNSVSPSSGSLAGERYLPPRRPSPISPITTSHHSVPVAIQSSPIGHHVSPNSPTSSSIHPVDRNIVSTDYLPPGQRPETFTQAIPSSTYLPSNQNQYSEIQPPPSIQPPTNTYLTPNKFSTASSGGFSGSLGDRHDVHLNSASLSQPAGHYYPDSGYPSTTNTGGYTYDQQPPAKYEFEYRVNDEYGNDYSHKESRDGDNTQGIYTVLLPDGRRQIVRYKADRDGYRPTITYEDAPVPGQSGYNQGYQY